MRLIQKATRSDPFYILAMLELCAIVDAAIFLSTIGYVRSNIRTTLLFSEWLDKQTEKGKRK